MTVKNYEGAAAEDLKIAKLRSNISRVEEPDFTRDYRNPEKRSVAKALTIKFGQMPI